MTMWMPFLVPAAILWIVGTFLLIRGLRGRKVDDHPLCRRCGFDLIGLPADVKTCSECGADVSSPRAIRIGHRKRRTGMAWAGVLLIAPVILGIALIGWMSVSNFKWIEHAPYWYVARESRSNVAAERDAALVELARRITANQLSAEQIKPLTDASLAAQADLNIPWSTGWGDVLDAAQAVGKLSDKDWKQYLANAPQFTMKTRPEIRRGDALPIYISVAPGRIGSRGAAYPYTNFSVEKDSDLVGAKAQTNYGRNDWGRVTASSGGGGSMPVISLDPKLVAAAQDGVKTIRVAMKVDVEPKQNTSYWSSTQPAPFASRVVHLQAQWKLVSADAPTIKLIDTPDPAATAAALVKATTISQLSFNPQWGDNVNLSLNFQNPPVPLAHKIFLRDPSGREWPITGIYVQAGGGHGWGTGGQAKGFDADVVDVIFRPDAKTALNTIEMHEYWSGEFTVPNVPVKWPTTRPAGAATRTTKPAAHGSQ
jgi:hypothetical protein